MDPFIVAQPQAQVLESGTNAALSVAAISPEPLFYQWFVNEVPILGATNAQYSLANVQFTDTGTYYCVVSNTQGSVASASVVVRVFSPPLPDEFNPNANNSVYALAVQADRKILVGGAFTSIDGQSCNYLARLHSDGSLDGEFRPNCTGPVYSLGIQPDGKLLVGGGFTFIAGQPRNYLARLNADGSLDVMFDPTAGGQVHSLTMLPNGKILVGGAFATMANLPRNSIARLNSDGSLDDHFDPNANGIVYSIIPQPNGRILIGGGFTSVGGQPRNRLARLHDDGSLDALFNPDVNDLVYALAVQADGGTVVGGAFTAIGGQPRNRIARLNQDDTLDSTFDPNANYYVYSLALQADGKVLAGGVFSSIGGQARNRIARFLGDGGVDPDFNPNASGNVRALALLTDGAVLVGGDFTSIGGRTRNRLARLGATELATQRLACEETAIRWHRGGTSPEVWRTSFESTTDGVNWTYLGAGDRILGGWQLNDLSLPENAVLRARGYLASGYRNASSWFVESFMGPPLITKQPEPPFQSSKATIPIVYEVGVIGSEPFSYLWQVSREGVTNSVGDTTNPSLLLTNPEGHEAWQYWVTVSNAFGSATSAPVSLRVLSQPSLTGQSIGIANDTWNLSFFAQTGAVYTIQTTPTLDPPVWVDAQSLVGGDSQVTLTNNIQLGSNQFFRIKME